MKLELNITALINEARAFCEIETKKNHLDLIGITDGKAVGTYVERRFQAYLGEKYDLKTGNSAKGIDLPSDAVNTDIKVTSIRQPQSSCPFKNARQKIFGLGYNLLVFVYDKQDATDSSILNFINCTFVYANRTADFTTTKRLREMIYDEANREDIIAYLEDRNVPGDDLVHNALADEILSKTPEQGYLTISNALQWRLQYGRIISLKNEVMGVINHEW